MDCDAYNSIYELVLVRDAAYKLQPFGEAICALREFNMQVTVTQSVLQD